MFSLCLRVREAKEDLKTSPRRERRLKSAFAFFRDYSYPLTLSKVNKNSWSRIQREYIKAQKEK